jgi:glycolate oxidase iron-sulfur subunit
MDDVTSTGADLVVTANPGCMIQLDSGLRERGVPGRSFHVIELLDWAYALADTNSSE